ncbi:PDZK1-interacting protein 1 isoform X2 [Archocentrus centrarchus]|uniref:PDZK1-interacting protein 1 isoform X2 n=1 Tax=Archocentrus centrarchus TaxID=63155 RepID=UPI0011E9E83C|nr:small integral membrane protein 24 isoform X2 [Archocentrus centrarchus]
MGTFCALASCLLLAVGAVTAQTEPSHTNERPLPQWLTGIIAISGFLFLAFVAILVKKAWCEKPYRSSIEEERENEFVNSNNYGTHLSAISKRNSADAVNENAYETSLDAFRSKDAPHAYDNLAIKGNKTTVM